MEKVSGWFFSVKLFEVWAPVITISGLCGVWDVPHHTGVSVKPGRLAARPKYLGGAQCASGEKEQEALSRSPSSRTAGCVAARDLISKCSLTVMARRVCIVGGLGASFGGMVFYHAPQRWRFLPNECNLRESKRVERKRVLPPF